VTLAIDALVIGQCNEYTTLYSLHARATEPVLSLGGGELQVLCGCVCSATLGNN